MSTPSTEETLVAPASDTQDNQLNSQLDSSASAIEAAPPQVAAEGTPFDNMVQDGAADGAGNGAVAPADHAQSAAQEATPNLPTSDESSAPAEVAEVTLQESAAQDTVAVDAAATAAVATDGDVAQSDGQVYAAQSDATTESTESGHVHVDASLEIDHRRAKQLLDRALLLSERGDFAGAILAARQAVVLTPTSPTGHSMLGLLHERAGDLEKAVASYEKVLQIAPHSTLERDSLERLKATLAQENASVIFHFDDNELFEEPEALPAPLPPRATTPSAPAPASAVVAASVLPSVASAAQVSSSGSTASASTAPGRVSSGPPALAPLTAGIPSDRTPVLRALSQRPSFYFKTVPLVATTALGLLFMAWAQGVSQSKRISELPVAPPPTAGLDVPKGGTPTNSEPTPLPAIGATTNANPTPPPPGTATGGDIFGNGKAGTVAQVGKAVVAPPSPGKNASRPATSGARASASTGTSGTATAPLLPSSTAPIIPQPAVPSGASGSASSPASGSGSGSGSSAPFAGLGPLTPRSDSAPAVRPGASSGAPAVAPVAPAPAAPAAPVAPSGDGGGNSRGGAFFNPGSQPRGVIRVDPMRPASATAPRPANVVRRAESTAAAAAAQGNTGRVIGTMSDSIQRLPTGYAYQRRAMAFADQGDYGRAADDFQSAIAAYNDQINHNQDVAGARDGLRTSQSGLRMALSNMRR